MIRAGLAPVLRLASWTAALVVAGRLLLAAGSPSLSVPLTSRHDLSGWVSETPPAEMAMAVLRLAALAGVAHLLAVTALATLARALRAPGAVAAVDRLSPTVVRRIVAGGSGLGLVLGGVAGSLPAPAAPVRPASTVAAAPATPGASPAPATATQARLPAAAATMTRVAGNELPAAERPEARTTASVAPATMRRSDDPPVGSGSATMARLDVEPGRAAGPALPATPAPPAAPAVDPARWVVEPGDSFWAIAEEVVATSGRPGAGERAVGRYWRQLIEANRARLVDPANPDLLLPGQQLVVPPLAG